MSLYFSFHVGSNCYDPAAYTAAVECAREVFDIASIAGFQFSLLDVGGGFPGASSASTCFDTVTLFNFSFNENEIGKLV